MKTGRSLLSLLEAIPQSVWIAAIALLSAVVMLGYAATPTHLAFVSLLLVPAILCSWFVGRGAALLVAAVTASWCCFIDQSSTPLRLGSITVAVNFSVQFAVTASVAWLVSELKTMLRFERVRANIDSATELFSRHGFMVTARYELERAKRFKRPFTIAYMDVDHFKAVNDALGHAAGDRLLSQIGAVVRRELRTLDIVSRFGGDEFVFLLPELAQADAQATIERLEKKLALSGRAFEIEVGFSFGLVSYPEADCDLESMIRIADERMYETKRNALDGRNKVHCSCRVRDFGTTLEM